MRSLLVCLLVACGGGKGDDISADDAVPDRIEAADYVEALESAECEFAVRCELAVDPATCEASNIRLNQDFKSLIAAIADGSVKYDAEAAARCVNHLAMAPCTFAGFHVDNPCDDVFVGQVTGGGACQVDGQCAGAGAICRQTNSQCNTSMMCCPGTCMGGLSESALGGPCDDGMHICEYDAVCTNRICSVPQATEGGPCTELDGCANPMVCNLNFTTGMGTCKTPAASGAACVRADARPCSDMREYCNAASLTCVRAAAVDASCVNGVPCVGYAQCKQNKCLADLTLGEACVVGPSEPECTGTLVCNSGTCKAPNTGMTCTL